MNKKITKTIGTWLLGILSFISIMLNVTLFSTCMELRRQNEVLNKELMDIKYSTFEIKPCPMCGSEDVKLLGNDSFYIYCDNLSSDGSGDGCGLRTAYYDSKQELIETWNSIPRE